MRKPTPTANDASANDQQRSRRGFRGTPPPLALSLSDLPDDALLTEYEAAAILRFSTNTLEAWRRSNDPPLEWELLGGRWIRYRAGRVKSLIRSGIVRGRGRKPTPRQSRSTEPDRRPEASASTIGAEA